MYTEDKEEFIRRLKRKVEVSIIAFAIILIVISCVYAYIIQPVKGKPVKSTIEIGYEEFKSFSLPIGDTTGTESYEERTVSQYVDDWGIRHILKERVR